MIPTLKAVEHSKYKGWSHVLYWSVCDWDQNWIKWSRPFMRADQQIKVTSELQKPTDQERGTNKNQTISILLIDQRSWSRSQTLQQVTRKWLPLEIRDRIFYFRLTHTCMESDFEWTWNGLTLSTYRKAAGVLSKHPTRIQNGAEAKKLVVYLASSFLILRSLVPGRWSSRIGCQSSNLVTC